MPTYSVSCRGDLRRGSITQLEAAGIYQSAQPEPGFSDAPMRHFLTIEASSPEDAILVARGALAVAGAEATDFAAEEQPPER